MRFPSLNNTYSLQVPPNSGLPPTLTPALPVQTPPSLFSSVAKAFSRLKASLPSNRRLGCAVVVLTLITGCVIVARKYFNKSQVGKAQQRSLEQMSSSELMGVLCESREFGIGKALKIQYGQNNISIRKQSRDVLSIYVCGRANQVTWENLKGEFEFQPKKKFRRERMTAQGLEKAYLSGLDEEVFKERIRALIKHNSLQSHAVILQQAGQMPHASSSANNQFFSGQDGASQARGFGDRPELRGSSRDIRFSDGAHNRSNAAAAALVSPAPSVSGLDLQHPRVASDRESVLGRPVNSVMVTEQESRQFLQSIETLYNNTPHSNHFTSVENDCVELHYKLIPKSAEAAKERFRLNIGLTQNAEEELESERSNPGIIGVCVTKTDGVFSYEVAIGNSQFSPVSNMSVLGKVMKHFPSKVAELQNALSEAVRKQSAVPNVLSQPSQQRVEGGFTNLNNQGLFNRSSHANRETNLNRSSSSEISAAAVDVSPVVVKVKSEPELIMAVLLQFTNRLNRGSHTIFDKDPTLHENYNIACFEDGVIELTKMLKDRNLVIKFSIHKDEISATYDKKRIELSLQTIKRLFQKDFVDIMAVFFDTYTSFQPPELEQLRVLGVREGQVVRSSASAAAAQVSSVDYTSMSEKELVKEIVSELIKHLDVGGLLYWNNYDLARKEDKICMGNSYFIHSSIEFFCNGNVVSNNEEETKEKTFKDKLMGIFEKQEESCAGVIFNILKNNNKMTPKLEQMLKALERFE